MGNKLFVNRENYSSTDRNKIIAYLLTEKKGRDIGRKDNLNLKSDEI